MRVFRVENERGDGMYTGYPNLFSAPGYTTELELHPSPLDESSAFRKVWMNLKRVEQESYSFGFSNVRQCLQWLFMNRWRKYLDKHGYMLVEYEVPDHDVIVGNRQVAFLKACAEQVEQHLFANLDE